MTRLLALTFGGACLALGSYVIFRALLRADGLAR